MPILVTLLLFAVVVYTGWPPPAFYLTPRQSAVFTACLVLASASAAALVSGSVARAVNRKPDRRAVIARRYFRWRQAAFFLNVGITLLCLFGAGWGWTVRTQVLTEWRGITRLAPLAELLVPAPYLLTLMLNWAVYWPAERALHHAGGSARPFWSLAGYWLYHARQFAVIVFPPVALGAAHQTVVRYFPQTAHSWWYQGLMPLAAVAVALVLPLALRPLLGLRRMPVGPVRERLQQTAARLRVRYADCLLWPTRGAMANALVVGLVPWARYVVFTDRLLDGLDADELDAVLGHEAGHVRHWHLPYYLLFFLLSSTAVTMAVVLGVKATGWDHSAWANDLLTPLTLAGLGVYLFAVFGWLSRVCERQADVFGSRAVSCGDPACDGHDADTPLAGRGAAVCPTGARTMARALERVMLLNGREPDQTSRRFWPRVLGWVRAWQHGPMSARVEFLHRVAERPELAAAHDRKAFGVRVFLAVALATVIAVAVIAGGQEMWQWL
jgi:STE24 endopeptidase